jgi:hypothetical protein
LLYNNKYLVKVKKNEVDEIILIFCNGKGGGDYRGSSELIGTWARDLISVSSKKPKGFKELIFNVKEI